MNPIVAAALASLLAACGQASPPATDNQVAKAPPAARPAAPAPKAFVFDEKNDLVDFHFAWSAEAAAAPQLVERFRKEMEQLRATSVENARQGKANDLEHGFEFRVHSHSTDYETDGQSDRMLSLRSEHASDTGGAHGNYGTSALLWDRAAAKEIAVSGLFTAPANMDRLLTQRWCDALNKAREAKRGEAVGGGMFDDCPKLDQIALIPADKNRNGRFETLVLVASPYVAGPWVEGSYEIVLPVTVDMISALKSEYQESFETGQPQ